MFNLSQIMKAAWVRYRDLRVRYANWQIKRMGLDASFSACLKTEWRLAKAAAAKAARQLRIDALLTGPKANTVRGLLTALDNVHYLSFRYCAAAERASIEHHLETLIGEVA